METFGNGENKEKAEITENSVKQGPTYTRLPDKGEERAG